MVRLSFGIDVCGLTEAERGSVIGQLFQLEIEVLIIIGKGDDKVLSLLAHEMRRSGIPCVTLAESKLYALPGTTWLSATSTTAQPYH